MTGGDRLRGRWQILALALVVLGLLGLVVPADAQQPVSVAAAVSGRVTDAESGRPLAGVMVTVEGTGHRVLTDSTGTYRLPRVPAGPQVLGAEMLGYAPIRMPVTVPARGSLRRDFALAVSALEIEGIVVTADPGARLGIVGCSSSG
ncbi:MAG: carboxypeptidase-like regulatory domain-containing protein [Actinomycetota bacterium]